VTADRPAPAGGAKGRGGPPFRIALAAACAALAALLALAPARAQDCPKIDPAVQQARERECRAAGGEWARFGAVAHLCGLYSCAPRTADGGKPCRSRAECEYLCVAKRPAALGSEATGECAAVQSPFGCITQVDAGRIAGTVCMD
jgi:hypothetical protein